MSNVLYLAEHREGSFRKQTLELSSYARALADLAGGTSTALVLGEIPADQFGVLGQYGTDAILHVQDATLENFDNGSWSAAITAAAKEAGATMVVLAASLKGKATAPAIAVKMNAGLAAGVTGLPAEASPFVVERKVYTGKAFARVEITTGNKVITLSPNSYELKEVAKAAEVKAWTPAEIPSSFVEVMETSKSEGKLLLTEAEIVVSAGRGMKGPEHWKPVEELAEVLGAATACSRPVSDEGWRPHSEHVGQTGKIIAPNLYFALGISGAVQHIAGVSSSKVIVAVNKDPDAPVFTAADYGILGDVHTVVPALVEAAKRFKENS